MDKSLENKQLDLECQEDLAIFKKVIETSSKSSLLEEHDRISKLTDEQIDPEYKKIKLEAINNEYVSRDYFWQPSKGVNIEEWEKDCKHSEDSNFNPYYQRLRLALDNNWDDFQDLVHMQKALNIISNEINDVILSYYHRGYK